MSDPGLKLPLTVAVLFLTLVLASLTLARRLMAPPAQVREALVPQTAAELPESGQEAELIPAEDEPEPPALAAEPAAQPFGWQTLDGREYYLLADGSPAVGLHRIGGRLFYFDQNGVKAKSLGVDVSYYDNGIDWELVKADGVDFAIIRVGGRGWTSGVLYGDCRTQEFLRLAREAGVKIGVYFYSTAIDPAEAVEEARAALKAVNGIPLDLPIFIDMEFSGEYPKGRADRLSPSQRAEIAIAFCETVRCAGYRAGVYASQNYLKGSIDYYAISRYTIWLASYTVNDRLPRFDKRYDLWQFTDRGRVNGIGGDADLNVIF
jgi:GH25 family lysozyme M1 (1,4-beta-N-acetylmuramidase)